MVEFINCKIGNHPEYDKGWKDCQNHQQQKIDELQKRIDEAIKEIQDESWSDEYGDNQAPTFKLIKILKGENHES